MHERILLVDDEETILFAAWDYLTARGYRVDRAATLKDADDYLDHRVYAVVITDLSLKGRSGTEGLDVIRSVRERCPGARTVLLTAYGSPDVQREARQRGANLVLHKPLPLARLANAVSELLGNS